MKVTSLFRYLLQASVALALVAASATTTQAATATTTYNPGTTATGPGDIFIGFRQENITSNTLAVNLGSVLQFMPTSLGGTWNGATFRVQFGVVPGTSTPVFDLNADLTAAFQSSWADNPNDGSGVSWAVAGVSSNSQATNYNVGGTSYSLGAKSAFLTVPRIDPLVLSNTPNFNNGAFSTAFSSFAQGSSGNPFKGRQSTENSTSAYLGSSQGSANANNWGVQIGPVGSTFSSSVLGEQRLSGPYSGPTNSVLDLYLDPSAGSTLVTDPVYLGSFYLTASGELYFTAVPEPSGLLLLSMSAGVFGMLRFRPRKLATA